MRERPDFENIADTTRFKGDRTDESGRRYAWGNKAGMVAAQKRGRLPSKIASSQHGLDPHRADKALRRFSWEDAE